MAGTLSSDAAPTALGRHFVLWALEQLGLSAAGDDQGIYWLAVPPEQRAAFLQRPLWRFTFDPELAQFHAAEPVELAAGGSRLAGWLTAQLQEQRPLVNLAPADQPSSVADLSSRLFSAYQVEGGTVQLAGCALEDRLVLRQLYWHTPPAAHDSATAHSPSAAQDSSPANGPQSLVELILGPEGQPLSGNLERDLGLDHLIACPRPPRLEPEETDEWLSAGRRQAEARWLSPPPDTADPAANGSADRETAASSNTASSAAASNTAAGLSPATSGGVLQLAATQFIWCKYAVGKLRFRIGEQEADLPFEGWARTLQAPPFCCPATGTRSFRLGATSDGRITALEEIEPCSASGRRVLRRELVQCTATGRRVLSDFVQTCPVRSEPVMTEAMVACQTCRQLVSPLSIRLGNCAACRSRQAVSDTDPRLERILSEHRALERWGGWKLAETATCYNLSAAGWLRRLLLIVDKQSLELKHVAIGSRFSPAWQPVEPADYAQAMS